MITTPTPRLSFDLPSELEASEPPEARGITRDAVRLLIAASDGLTHTTFGELPRFLRSGDLVVINTSGTIPAAVDAVAEDGTVVVLHLSNDLGDGTWVVEPRRPAAVSTERWTGPLPSRSLRLADGTATLLAPYRDSGRLWTARLDLPAPPLQWLAAHGRPIRYGYVPRPWPLSAYQNVFANEPGSAEMPSAGRPFTPEVLMRLVAHGVGVTPLVLHTGVASLEADELPYPERFRVPAATADRVNDTHAHGGRVIAIGTTVVRALESSLGDDGLAHASDGWTDLVIRPDEQRGSSLSAIDSLRLRRDTPVLSGRASPGGSPLERGVGLVDGLLTGWHEPEASHLLMLEAVAGRALVERSYDAGLAEGYRWHEFGDTHLLLP